MIEKEFEKGAQAVVGDIEANLALREAFELGKHFNPEWSEQKKMKRIVPILLSIICVIVLAGCSGSSSPNTAPSEPPVSTTEPSAPSKSKTPEQSQEGDTMPTVNIQIGDKNFTAFLHDNESARTIVQAMPFTLEMDDFASQEKVTDLTFALPAARTVTPATINAGELYLWSGNKLVLFYTTFSNSYSYVQVGYITDVAGLTEALGSGIVEVTFSAK